MSNVFEFRGKPISTVAEEYVVKCPHGRRVFKTTYCSVTLFVHEDGTPCEPLNALTMPKGGFGHEEGEVNVVEMLSSPSGIAKIIENDELLRKLLEMMFCDDDLVLKVCSCGGVSELLRKFCTFADKHALFKRICEIVDKRGEGLDLAKLLPMLCEVLGQE
ncbi:MAG: hypothetical protein DRJ31_02180 [Candidatus Methanomethylicota archaeon]|uniref:Uncharacterized protein n=1 Tax=Thermoproteota archaeon TaxID=2056631 RepID=A0A497EXU6_9CREN|nr:MAG: hypothetical protein DRJ31_02180 [Candidatus Verstraetearchaeota archaeon]RLE52006.1 MAG: hypothetical protein DRJ33_04705 [Candidatus Verstraetearchaeota archaeon]